jgi:hypothetical protein
LLAEKAEENEECQGKMKQKLEFEISNKDVSWKSEDGLSINF